MVIVENNRLRIDSVMLRFRTSGGGVDAVHVYDGETKIATEDNPAGRVDSAGWTRVRVGVDSDKHAAVRWGIGILIKLRFGRHGGG